jgi:hypothetical protein
MIFDIMIGKPILSWDTIGKGYLGIGGQTTIKQRTDGPLRFDINSNLKI